MKIVKTHRRIGILPKDVSISFYYQHRKIEIFVDSGRLMRPLYYLENNKFISKELQDKILVDDFQYMDLFTSFEKKKILIDFKTYAIFNHSDLYERKIANSSKFGPIEYVDTNETETSLIALNFDELTKTTKKYSFVEIDPSLTLGVMGNQIIFPENNPPTRNAFSCGQTNKPSLYIIQIIKIAWIKQVLF